LFCLEVIGATVYWLVGYAFAYGDGNEFIGWTGFALQGVSPSKLSFWFYQTIFANTASTIVRYLHSFSQLDCA
jgi:Amt family ammonium transporter